MTDSPADADDTEADPETGGALSRPLSDEEFALLKAMWVVAFSNQIVPNGVESGWQTWDYIWRMTVRNDPSVSDPDEVLAGLPTVPVPDTVGRVYGLFWRMPAASDGPRCDIIGLTIAGVSRLSERLPQLDSYADTLTQFVASVARAANDLEPRRDGAATGRRTLADFGMYLEALRLVERGASTDVVPPAAVGQLLQREYAPITVGSENGEWFADLAWSRGGGFASIDTAAAYLRKIDSDTRRNTAAVEAASPLTLIQTLDYLSYVIGAHPAWPKQLRLVSAPDLQSAAVIGQPVDTQVEFERAVAATWNVISQLQLPDNPVVTPGASGSITKLQSWLEQNVGNPIPLNVSDALAQIRAVGRMRTGFQHSSPSARKVANEAKQRLGIPVFTADWAAAWRVTQGQLAASFDTIRQAIQDAEFTAGEM